jgi:hypothetical protein
MMLFTYPLHRNDSIAGSDGQVALWYIIVILYGMNLGGFEAFIFSTFGQLFGDRADVCLFECSNTIMLTMQNG